MIKNTITKYLVGLCVSMLFFSCEIQEDFKYQYAEDNTRLEVSAFEYIRQNDMFSMLAQAIEITGLDAVYKNNGYTFIIPSDQAFKDYMNDNGYSSIADIPLPILKNILKYHIVEGEINFNDPELSSSNKPIAYMTENGQDMFLSHTSTYVGLINEGTNRQWQISTSNLVPTNGVMHVVNNIVYYSAPTGDINAVNPDLVQDTIFAKHDTYVNGGAESSKSFGSETLLKIKNVAGDGDYDRKAFLMFDFDDFSKEGVVTDLKLQLAVSFTHAKGVDLNLFETPNTSWTETSLNFSNADFPTKSRVSYIKTSKINTFDFDLTDYYKETQPDGLRSYMLDGQPGSDETDEIASKEHPTLAPPMIIATLASGNSELSLEILNDVSLEQGGMYVLSGNDLKVGGALPGDIVYTIEEIPVFGWLIKGADVLKVGSKFSQMDLDMKNIVFIQDGISSGSQKLILTARDKAGAILEDIRINISTD